MVKASSWGYLNTILCNQMFVFLYLYACSIPADRSGPGGLGGGFHRRNVFTKGLGMMTFTHFYNVTTCWLACTGFTQADKTELVDSVHRKKSQVSIIMKHLYVFVSVCPATERMVWLCASVSHYTIPRSWPVSQSRDVTLTHCWSGSFFNLFPNYM